MFLCIIGCDEVFWNYNDRMKHLVQYHLYTRYICTILIPYKNENVKSSQRNILHKHKNCINNIQCKK